MRANFFTFSWKTVLLTLVLGGIFFFYAMPIEYYVSNDFVGGGRSTIEAPIGIENPYIVGIISLGVGYLLTSVLFFLIVKIKKSFRK